MFECKCDICGKTLNGLTYTYGDEWTCSECIDDKSNILHAEKGCKCKVLTFNAGYECEQKEAKELLSLDKEYTVERVEVNRSNTDVFLKEFPDTYFNSVFFERVQ